MIGLSSRGPERGSISCMSAHAGRIRPCGRMEGNEATATWLFEPKLQRLFSQTPHLELDIPRRILQEYRELILNKQSIKATRGLWSYGWHIDRYGLRLAGPRYGRTPRLLIVDSQFSHRKRPNAPSPSSGCQQCSILWSRRRRSQRDIYARLSNDDLSAMRSMYLDVDHKKMNGRKFVLD